MDRELATNNATLCQPAGTVRAGRGHKDYSDLLSVAELEHRFYYQVHNQVVIQLSASQPALWEQGEVITVVKQSKVILTSPLNNSYFICQSTFQKVSLSCITVLYYTQSDLDLCSCIVLSAWLPIWHNSGIRYMWWSWIEIQYYSVAHFELITKFESLAEP